MKKIKLFLVLCLSTHIGFAQVLNNVAGNGTSGNSGNGGLAVNAQLYGPTGVAVDPAGNMYIVDNSASVIRKVTAGTGIITTIAGNGTAGYGGDGGPCSSALLNHPLYVCLDSPGNLYISDAQNHRVRKIIAQGGQITSACTMTTVAGDGTYNIGASTCGDGGPAIYAQLNTPIGIAVDNIGNLYIADQVQASIRKVNASGIISTIAGDPNHTYLGNSGDGGPAQYSYLGNVAGLGLDNSSSNLYITDCSNQRVRKITLGTGIINAFAGNGTGGFGGDNGPAINANFNLPRAVAVDVSGNVYISDQSNARIRKINTSNIISTIAGGTSYHFSPPNYLGAGVTPLSAVFQPSQLAVDGCGNIYFADNANYAIGKITYGTIPVFNPYITTTPYCNGSNITATGHYSGSIPADSYTWNIQSCNSSGVPIDGYNSGILSYNGDPNGVLFTFPNTSNIACNQNYLITFTVKKNCPTPHAETATQIIYYNCSPVPVISGNVNICSATSTTLCQNYIPSSLYTVTWNVGHGGTHTQCITVAPTVNTTYNVTVTNTSTGCTGTASVLVTVQNIDPHFTLTSTLGTGNTYYTIEATNATYITGDPTFGYWWGVEEVPYGSTYPYTAISGTEIDNSNCWWVEPSPVWFAGYQGGTYYPTTTTALPCSSNFGAGAGVGVFTAAHEYLITYGTWSNTCPWKAISQTAYLCSGCKFENEVVQSNITHEEVLNIQSQKSKAITIEIYPNPSTGNFTVETTEMGSQLLQVFDVTGKIVISETIGSTASINANGLPEGIYNVKITNNQNVINKRIVISR
jgi:hypothetical protein